MIVEADGQIITVPDDAIKGKTKNTDGSWDFQLVGGPCHGYTCRVYTLGEDITFDTAPTSTYVMTPPIKRGTPWVYVHQRKETK